MTTHLFYHNPATPEPCALQSWLSLWPAFLPQDTVLVLTAGGTLPALPARATIVQVNSSVDGMPLASFMQAINRGAELAHDDWICVWRSDCLYPCAYHAALQTAMPISNLILPYETLYGMHYCDAAWCQANCEAILNADEDELVAHAVVAASYEMRAFPHFAVSADLWRHTGGFDARLHSERAAVAEWIQRVGSNPACAPVCLPELLAFRQNTQRRIQLRLVAPEMQQAERELLSVVTDPHTAHSLLHDDLPPLRPRRPRAQYSSLPRAPRPVAAVPSSASVFDQILDYAREQLHALALSACLDYAAFLIRCDARRDQSYHLMGTALYAQGRRFEAVEAFTQSVIRARENREYVRDLLMLWRDLHSLESALHLSHEWITQHPGDAEMRELADWFAARQAEKATSCSLHRFFQPGALVFDVGAHYAVKAQEMLRQGAGGMVCFDCQPNCIAALQQKYRDVPNVAVMPVGLANQPGEIRFSICSAGEGISTFSNDWKQGRFANMNWDQTIVAPVTTLDLMIARFGRPAYCKIDVEGFEYTVLRGLTQPIPCVSFEFAKEFLAQTRACLEYLAGLGFDGFDVMIGDDERLLFGQATSLESLMSVLEQSPDQLLWGDVYAFCSRASGDMPDLERLNVAPPASRTSNLSLCAAA